MEDASFENLPVGESPRRPFAGHDFATLLADDDRRESGPVYGSPYLGEAGIDDDISAFSDPVLAGITEEELDQQCSDLFSSTPIKFLPRRSSDLDGAIAESIKELELKIPI